ncbi:MAG TPA: hypothetical protein VFV98_18090 [Vicinamibacterales bacterium]|nr:hypothetical protein [Vicinamibacterales bacterium]
MPGADDGELWEQAAEKIRSIAVETSLVLNTMSSLSGLLMPRIVA